MSYNDQDDRSPQERANFEENLRRFHEGDADAAAVDTLFAGLDMLARGEDLPPAPVAPCADDDDTAEIIRPPVTLTPWDKARAKVVEAQERLDKAKPSTVNHAIATWLLAHAKELLAIENQRDGDKQWRTRRTVDGWRKGEGRDAYNATRRKVRDQPNADLSALTEEERNQHLLNRNKDNQWKSRKRKAGWTDKQIEEGLEQRKAKRRAKNEQDK